MKTVQIKYPCPICGKYYLPDYHLNGYAIMECKKHGLFKTSVKVSKNFRKFCSKIAKKSNRSPIYYTSFEKRIKNILDKFGYREGLDYFHNVRIKDTTRKTKKGQPIYYWLDFLIPLENLVIEASPKIWHRMWNRESSDKKKIKFLESLGLTVITITEDNFKELRTYLKWSIL
jgi:endogenous inhibitor of DNA gyrase (YacG/DUF329 family)